MNQNVKYNMSFEEAQDYISKRGLDIPWNDDDVVIDESSITQTVANVLKWADEHPIKYIWKEETSTAIGDKCVELPKYSSIIEYVDEVSGGRCYALRIYNNCGFLEWESEKCFTSEEAIKQYFRYYKK